MPDTPACQESGGLLRAEFGAAVSADLFRHAEGGEVGNESPSEAFSAGKGGDDVRPATKSVDYDKVTDTANHAEVCSDSLEGASWNEWGCWWHPRLRG